MNIFEKLSAITNEITAVAKNLNVGYGQSSYKAVGEADVLAAVRPIEAKYKVYSYPAFRQVIDSGVLTSIDRNGNEKRQNYLRVQVTYRFVNMEKPEEVVDMITYGDGVDSGDKAPGKAMTYADKYALLKAYKIITGDDPDQKASEELKVIEIKKINSVKAKALQETLEEAGVNISSLLKEYGVKGVSDLTESQHADVIRRLEKYGRKA